MAFRGKDSRALKITLDKIKEDTTSNSKDIIQPLKTKINTTSSREASMDSPRVVSIINITRTTNTLEDSLIMTCRGINQALEDSLIMTCRGINKVTKHPGSNIIKVDSTKEVTLVGTTSTTSMTSPIEDRAMETSSTMTQGGGPLVDRADQEIDPIAGVVILPEMIITTAIEILTLVMGVINEETARRS